MQRVPGKLQTLVYDILSSTTAVTGYAIGRLTLTVFRWCSNWRKVLTNDSNDVSTVANIYGGMVPEGQLSCLDHGSHCLAKKALTDRTDHSPAYPHSSARLDKRMTRTTQRTLPYI